MFKTTINVIFIFALIIVNPISNNNAVVYSQTSGSYPEFVETGIASWYGPGFHGRKTANGERFNTNELTAAHKTLPFNTILKVTNLENDRYTIVRVNDRGPYARGRIIDLSYAAKSEIGMKGLAKVKIEIVNPEVNTEKTISEDLTSLSFFKDAISISHKIYLKFQDNKSKYSETKFKTQDILRDMISTFKKVKIVLDNSDQELQLQNDNPEIDELKIIDITNNISSINGYSIEIAHFENEIEAEKLIGDLELLNFDDVILVELQNNDSKHYKVYLGYYETSEDAADDIRILNNNGYSTELLKVLG